MASNTSWAKRHPVATGLLIAFGVVAVILIIVLPIVLTRKSNGTSTETATSTSTVPREAWTDWVPQMWCFADNTSSTCQASKPAGAKDGWQNKTVSDTAVGTCPDHPTGYPSGLPASVTSWLQGVDAGTNKCNLESDYNSWVQAYKDCNQVQPEGWPQNDVNFYPTTNPGANIPPEYMTSKYPQVCPPGSNCYTVNTSWGAEGGGTCASAPSAACTGTQPRWNWVLGACMGTSCVAYGASNDATKRFKDMGSRAVVNYVAAYNFDKQDKLWKIARDSSFNTDASHDPYDLLKAYGGLDPTSADRRRQPWLLPQTHLAYNYQNGYAPNDAEGLGPLATQLSTPGLSANGNSGAFMIVISMEDSFGHAFFTLNQNALVRLNTTNGWDNCWSGANGGENEMMENPFSISNSGEQQSYSRTFPNNYNNQGRAYQRLEHPDSAGVAGFTNTYQWSGGLLTSTPQAEPSATPFVFAFVFDGVGQWNYRIPASELQEGLWPGLYHKTASGVVDARPARPPSAPVNTCMSGKNDYCLSFMPFCPFLDAATAAKAGCSTSGWCGNWLGLMTDTVQWQMKDNGEWEGDGASEPIYVNATPAQATTCWQQPFPNVDPSTLKPSTENKWQYVCDDPQRSGCSDCTRLGVNKAMFAPLMPANVVTQPWGGDRGPENQRELGYVRACADTGAQDYSTRCNPFQP